MVFVETKNGLILTGVGAQHVNFNFNISQLGESFFFVFIFILNFITILTTEHSIIVVSEINFTKIINNLDELGRFCWLTL